jgi:ABC-type branched-subunit amino acid transport system substrate-binding protein
MIPVDLGAARHTAPGEITAGVSIAATGWLAPQGREALEGLRLWVSRVAGEGGLVVTPGGPRRGLRLVVLDDESRAARAGENVRALLDDHRVDLLLGPYGSGLVFAAAATAAARGRVLWNHGGTADTLWTPGCRLVSVPSPASDYLRALPSTLRRQDPGLARIVVLVRDRGAFAPAVARGIVEGAAGAGCTVSVIPVRPPLDARTLLDRARGYAPHLVVTAGSFADDVAVVRHRDRLERRTRLAAVAAGVEAFGREAGEAAEGVVGPSQWEPETAPRPAVGPDAGWFVEAYRRAAGGAPGYVAAPACARGIVLAECVRRAGTLEDAALLATARALTTTTFFGDFRLDPATLRQVGHRGRLVEWRQGRKVVWPAADPA